MTKASGFSRPNNSSLSCQHSLRISKIVNKGEMVDKIYSGFQKTFGKDP